MPTLICTSCGTRKLGLCSIIFYMLVIEWKHQRAWNASIEYYFKNGTVPLSQQEIKLQFKYFKKSRIVVEKKTEPPNVKRSKQN